MRRTTISRSSAAGVAAVTLLSLAAASAPAAAQQSRAPDAGQPAAAAVPTNLPPTHLVAQGETLWSLAQQYFGDPLLWPEIYRLNTDVIEDAHWIFPGEELRLIAPAVTDAQTGAVVVAISPSGDTVAQVPARPAGDPNAPTIFSPARAQADPRATELEVDAARAYRAVREGEYYSASFLTGEAELVTGRLLGNEQSSSIRRLSTTSTATLFTDVVVTSPAGEPLQPGDLLLAVRRVGDIRGHGDVIRPTGILRVTAAPAPERVAARVTALFGTVTNGQEVIRVARFPLDRSARPQDISDGITGTVVGLLDPTDVVSLQKSLFIDRGMSEGVRLGDVFALIGTDRTREGGLGSVEQEQGQAIVVNVQPHTATLLIIQVSRPDIRAGSVARQIRRMPT